jgi:hypothetical protein
MRKSKVVVSSCSVGKSKDVAFGTCRSLSLESKIEYKHAMNGVIWVG